MNNYHSSFVQIERNDLHLWFTCPFEYRQDEIAERNLLLLSQKELAKLKSFIKLQSRNEYLASRVLVRSVLSHYYPLTPECWCFKYNVFGKPATVQETGIHFNLSNSSDLVVCLIASNREVGVDLEPINNSVEIEKLKIEIFSESEMAEFKLLSEREKKDRALSLWTLKEAYIKASGIGLSIPLKKISFIFNGSNNPHLVLEKCVNDYSGRWHPYLFNYAGHRVAIIAEKSDFSRITVFEMSPSSNNSIYKSRIL